jgi:hypothetical protein
MPQEIFAKEPLGGHWTAFQRLFALVGVAAFVIASLWPPWTVAADLTWGQQRVWGLLFKPPFEALQIDWPILAFEWFVILVATVILVWVFRGQSKSDR